MTTPAHSAGLRSERRTVAAILVVVAGLVAVLLTTTFFFARSVKLEATESLAENEAIARGVAAFIMARQEAHLGILSAYAGRFRFREVVKQRDPAEAVVHLRQLHESFPGMDRAGLADPSGVIWAAYPDTPELYGRSLAQRDWYQGVSREWRPYVSDVFAAGSDQALAVALSVPIRDLAGAVIGIIIASQRLQLIRQWFLPIQIPGGDLYVVDRKGQLVFHRTRTGPERLADYAPLPVVERVLRGEAGVAEAENPVDGEVRLTAYQPLPSLGWGLVVQRSKARALYRTRALMLVSGGAGLMLTVTLACLGGVALQHRRRAFTTLRALEEKTLALQEAQETLVRKERLAVLGQLAGGVGHELRNPLGVIKNSLYYLKMILPKDERVSKHLGILEREVGTANRIVSDMLDFARVRPPRRVPTVLSVLARETLERTALPDRVTVMLTLAEELPPVSIDPDQVAQVLHNLLTNAVQAMPDGGVLTIVTAEVVGGALVAVSDTGQGIPPEHLEKIFQPLFTTRAKGIGLGLAVAKGLAEANGGTIGVDSVPGHGSCFTVRFLQPAEAKIA